VVLGEDLDLPIDDVAEAAASEHAPMLPPTTP